LANRMTAAANARRRSKYARNCSQELLSVSSICIASAKSVEVAAEAL